MRRYFRSAAAGKIVLCIIALCLVPVFAGSSAPPSLPVSSIGGKDYISLNALTRALKIENSFDVVYQKGRLYYKSHYLVYKTGYCAVIIDNRIYSSSVPVMRWKGGIYLPVDTAREAIGSMFAGYSTDVVRGRMLLSSREKPAFSGKTAPPQRRGGEKIGFIIIDAGHGGKDPGAIGKGGLREKDITLKLSKKVAAILRRRFRGIKIKTTRNRDKFIELAERTEIANRELRKNTNGIFVSIHVNASIISRISGFETYFLSQNPTNEQARKTAALENGVIILEKKSKKKKKYDDVDFVEALMMTTQIQKESSMLAESIQKSMDRKISRFKSRGVHRADFFVLRGALMPAVLVEVGFITNKKESGYLKKSSHQNRIAAGICDGIGRFINSYNKSLKGKH